MKVELVDVFPIEYISIFLCWWDWNKEKNLLIKILLFQLVKNILNKMFKFRMEKFKEMLKILILMLDVVVMLHTRFEHVFL